MVNLIKEMQHEHIQLESLISPLAEELARQLTVKYSIREGFGLAIYLGINRCYKNHHAVRIWIQLMLEKDKHNDSLECLKAYFWPLFHLIYFNKYVFRLSKSCNARLFCIAGVYLNKDIKCR